MKLRIDDNVLVTTGKYRGKTGKIMRISEKTNRVVVEKVNIRTQHVKKRQGQAGQKIHYEAPFDASNVIVICPHCSKITRVSFIRLKTGKKQRVCKKCSQSLDKPVERKRTKKK
ncbi:50S ribosomal protein L24 [Candidatus Peregrinibacteria bacterium]|nr:50S ribosomal protein L24 [Candidatus Peregrinibacteria bacterium]